MPGIICGIAGKNQPTGVKFSVEIINLRKYLARILLLAILVIRHGLPSDIMHSTGNCA